MQQAIGNDEDNSRFFELLGDLKRDPIYLNKKRKSEYVKNYWEKMKKMDDTNGSKKWLDDKFKAYGYNDNTTYENNANIIDNLYRELNISTDNYIKIYMTKSGKKYYWNLLYGNKKYTQDNSDNADGSKIAEKHFYIHDCLLQNVCDKTNMGLIIKYEPEKTQLHGQVGGWPPSPPRGRVGLTGPAKRTPEQILQQYYKDREKYNSPEKIRERQIERYKETLKNILEPANKAFENIIRYGNEWVGADEKYKYTENELKKLETEKKELETKYNKYMAENNNPTNAVNIVEKEVKQKEYTKKDKNLIKKINKIKSAIKKADKNVKKAKKLAIDGEKRRVRTSIPSFKENIAKIFTAYDNFNQFFEQYYNEKRFFQIGSYNYLNHLKKNFNSLIDLVKE